MVVVNAKAARDILAAAAAVGGPLAGAVCRLIKSSVSVDKNTTWAQLIECDFAGYAASAALVWATPYNVVRGAKMEANRVQFTATGPTPENSVKGYAITTSGATPVLLAVERFDNDVGISQAGDAVGVTPSVEFIIDPEA